MHASLTKLKRAIQAVELIEKALTAHGIASDGTTDGFSVTHAVACLRQRISWSIDLQKAEVAFEYVNGEQWPCVYYDAEQNAWVTRLSSEAAERNPEYARFAEWMGVTQTSSQISPKHAAMLISFLARCFVYSMSKETGDKRSLECER